ncbi:MAG: TRAP transporter small permease subunit [Syntrophaceae bacterium]|nr:TRAP transporter small permease subunit [Syntrophaceae bacterium]
MKVLNYIDKISEWTGIVVSWIIVPLTFVVVYEVIMRHFFNAPTGWGYDTCWMLYSAQFMIGGAYTLLKKGHVRIDIVYNTLSLRGKLIFDTIVYAVVFSFIAILFTWAGVRFAYEAWATNEKLSTTNWFFPSGPIKTVIPIAFFLLSLQSLTELIRSISTLFNPVRNSNGGIKLRPNDSKI